MAQLMPDHDLLASQRIVLSQFDLTQAQAKSAST